MLARGVYISSQAFRKERTFAILTDIATMVFLLLHEVFRRKYFLYFFYLFKLNWRK